MLAFPWLALLVTAVLASLPPVVRAARIDPAILLRAE
jgi:ABC-type lipoprotein release transport system permease subunit